MENQWWTEDYGFFGTHYLEGDNSTKGYLINKEQTLSERTIEEVNGVIKLLGIQEGQSLLDIPCGYGRHSIGISQQGIKVVGVDINQTHLNVAIENSENQISDVTFIHDNMLEIKYANQFDAVINMFYSFGFFESDEDNLRTLDNFYNSLKPGGKFLMHTDVNIPRIIAGKYKEYETRELQSGNTLEIYDNYNEETKRIEGRWIIHKESGEKIDRDYSVRVYTREEFVDMCLKVGFTSCEVYSDWDGTPYDENSEDMIVIASK